MKTLNRIADTFTFICIAQNHNKHYLKELYIESQDEVSSLRVHETSHDVQWDVIHYYLILSRDGRSPTGSALKQRICQDIEGFYIMYISNVFTRKTKEWHWVQLKLNSLQL